MYGVYLFFIVEFYLIVRRRMKVFSQPRFPFFPVAQPSSISSPTLLYVQLDVGWSWQASGSNLITSHLNTANQLKRLVKNTVSTVQFLWFFTSFFARLFFGWFLCHCWMLSSRSLLKVDRVRSLDGAGRCLISCFTYSFKIRRIRLVELNGLSADESISLAHLISIFFIDIFWMVFFY